MRSQVLIWADPLTVLHDVLQGRWTTVKRRTMRTLRPTRARLGSTHSIPRCKPSAALPLPPLPLCKMYAGVVDSLVCSPAGIADMFMGSMNKLLGMPLLGMSLRHSYSMLPP